MVENASTVPLASSEREAFDCFRILAQQGVTDIRGEYIEIDLGNYVHVLDQEERLEQIPWVAPTLERPDYIIRLTGSRKGKRPKVTENYVKRIRESPNDPEGSIFVVGVERTRGHLRLRTWFMPARQEKYVQDLLKRGETIWEPKK
jgi:hypothetical protein